MAHTFVNSVDIPSRITVAITCSAQTSGFSPLVLGHDSGVTIQYTSTTQADAPISLDYSNASVHSVAVPQGSPNHVHPAALKNNIILAAASSSTTKILLFPGTPSDDVNNSMAPTLLTELQADRTGLVAVSWIDNLASSKAGTNKASLLVASCSRSRPSILSFARVILDCTEQNITVSQKTSAFQTVSLPDSVASISFHPAPRSTKLLIAGVQGITYIYDPFAVRSSEGLTHINSSLTQDPHRGAWLGSFTTGFSASNDETHAPRNQAQRKRIISASWTNNGSAIIALLSGGQWGVWDVAGLHAKPADDLTSFALWGMIGSNIPSQQSSAIRKSLESNTLPTMTPSTRKLKAEALFSGITTSRVHASSGGIAISGSTNASVIVFWYNGTVAYIDDFESYWARAVKRSAEAKLLTAGGSLFGPGLARLDGLEISGQTIISAAQLFAGRGKISALHTIAVATEHQVVYSARDSTQSLNGPTNSLLSHRPKVAPIHYQIRSSGQLMELDITSMDAILDNMDGDVMMSGAL